MTDPDRIPLPEARWYVALTAPRMEFKAAAELRRSGYFTWLPFERVTKFYKRPGSNNDKRPQTTNEPYFPRYIFVGLRYHGQDLGATYDTTHVSTILKSPMTGQPYQISDAAMDRIVALGEGTECVRVIDKTTKAKSRKKYRKGEAVRLTGTPFDDFVALVERDIGGKELWVEVDVLGGKRKVAVKPEQIEDDKRKAA